MSKTKGVLLGYAKPFIKLAKQVQKRLQLDALNSSYHAWATQNEERCFVSHELKSQPLISIVTPVFNPSKNDFAAMLYSVINQHYENWELIIVNASTDPALQSYAKELSVADRRIIVIDHHNQGISANTNVGLEAAKGEYITFLDHDDLLHPCALHTCAATMINENADLVYTDEDKIKADDSLYFDPFLKPGWSPHLLQNVNYINHITMAKTKNVKDIKGLRSEYDGAQDFDLLLRLVDKYNPKIVHIPRVLYHWRAAANSTAASIGTKPYVLKAGTKALQEHLGRNNVKATAKAIVNRPGFYHLEFKLPQSATIVIAQTEQALRRRCILWLQELLLNLNDYSEVQIVIEDWAEDLLTKPKRDGITFTYVPRESGLAEVAPNIKHEACLFFKVAASPSTPEYINNLLGRAFQQPGVIVAPLIISQNNTILDAGLVSSTYGLQELFTGLKLSDNTYFGTTEWVRNVDGLELNIFAASKQTMKELLISASGEQLGQKELAKFIKKNPSVNIVLDAHSPHVFRGYLNQEVQPNTTHFNPQLTHSYSPITIKTGEWGNIETESERDNEQ